MKNKSAPGTILSIDVGGSNVKVMTNKKIASGANSCPVPS